MRIQHYWNVSRVGVLLIVLLLVVIGCEDIQSHSVALHNNAPVASTPSTLLELDQIPTTPHAVLTSVQVINYVGTSEFMGGATLSGKPPTILVCQKTTVGEAESKLGSDIADDKSAPVFLVELQGPFTIPHAIPPSHRRTSTSMTSVAVKPPIVDKAYEVFDATNGNVLLWGIMDDSQGVPLPAQTAITQEGLVP